MRLYNTLSRKIEDIKPLEKGRIKMYTCGLTVYSQPQIGNWVAYIYSDVLFRCLVNSGYEVDRVQNITDVGHLVSDDDAGEDKMEKGARAEGKTAWDIADKYIKIADIEAYGMLDLIKPKKIVRATSLIKEQIDFVIELEKKGFTYIIPNEGVYFDTSKISNYGHLARLDIRGLKEGARVEITGKRNVTDFALWKFSPKNRKRDMEWESPWGKGFPGWHLECSVIARVNLGDQIDIHTGGIDHIPVHHTNEIAQTESLTGKQFVKYWFHNNHIKINGSKMAKSLGNSYTLHDIIDKGYDIQSFKLMVLSSHYRTEGNFSWEILDGAQNLLKSWQQITDRIWQLTEDGSNHTTARDILAALQDDLNTPKAISVINTYFNNLAENIAPHKEIIDSIDKFLGIRLLSDDIPDDIKSLIEKRELSRIEKDWVKSDELRFDIEKRGFGLNDTDSGTIWYRLS